MRKSALAFMLAGLFAAQSSQALVLEMTPASQIANIGQSFVYDVKVSGLGNEVLSAFDIAIGYNTSILGFDSIIFGSGLDLGIFGDSLQDFAGTLNVNEVTFLDDATLGAGQADDFVLFTVTFKGLSAGQTNLQMTLNSMAGHSEPDPIFGDPISVELIPDSIVNAAATVRSGTQPPAVPEPSVLALLGLGALGLMSARRARKN